MKFINDIMEMIEWRHGISNESIIGLVPAIRIHNGHLWNIKFAKVDCNKIIVCLLEGEEATSTFSADYHSFQTEYSPFLSLSSTDSTSNLKLLEPIKDLIDVVFVFNIDSIKEGESKEKNNDKKEARMETGKSKIFNNSKLATELLEALWCPSNYFNDILTLIMKMIHACRPDRYYMGQKDYQLGKLLEMTFDDMILPIDVIMVPTVRREPFDTLACSNRNNLLNGQDERESAHQLYKSLNIMVQSYLTGEMKVEELLKNGMSVIESHSKINLQYLKIMHMETMEELIEINPNEGAICMIAAKIGSIRLIDNIIMAPNIEYQGSKIIMGLKRKMKKYL